MFCCIIYTSHESSIYCCLWLCLSCSQTKGTIVTNHKWYSHFKRLTKIPILFSALKQAWSDNIMDSIFWSHCFCLHYIFVSFIIVFMVLLAFFVNRSWYPAVISPSLSNCHNIFFLSRCFIQHQNHGEMVMNTWNNKQKIMHKISQKTSKNWQTIKSKTQKYQNCSKIKSRVLWQRKLLAWLVISKYASTWHFINVEYQYHQVKGMINIKSHLQRSFWWYRMFDIIDMIFMYHTKNMIKTMKMSSCQNNRKFTHVIQKIHMICINKEIVIDS